jgi:hypothetical protein
VSVRAIEIVLLEKHETTDEFLCESIRRGCEELKRLAKQAAEKLISPIECTSAAKAAIDFAAIMARLEAAPFQNRAARRVFQQPANLKRVVLLHFRHEEVNKPLDCIVNVGGVEGVGGAGPNQLSIRCGGDIDVGFDAHLFFFFQVAG